MTFQKPSNFNQQAYWSRHARAFQPAHTSAFVTMRLFHHFECETFIAPPAGLRKEGSAIVEMKLRPGWSSARDPRSGTHLYLQSRQLPESVGFAAVTGRLRAS